MGILLFPRQNIGTEHRSRNLGIQPAIRHETGSGDLFTRRLYICLWRDFPCIPTEQGLVLLSMYRHECKNGD